MRGATQTFPLSKAQIFLGLTLVCLPLLLADKASAGTLGAELSSCPELSEAAAKLRPEPCRGEVEGRRASADSASFLTGSLAAESPLISCPLEGVRNAGLPVVRPLSKAHLFVFSGLSPPVV